MPWWNVTASVNFAGAGNSTLMEYSLYLYGASAGVLVNPPSQIVTLNLWFCWATLVILTLAGILAVVVSLRPRVGRRMLVLGGFAALLSVVVFAAGLQTELSATGSGLDLFKTAEGNWGTLSAYPSFGFWGGLVAAAIMLFAARRSSAVAIAPPVTVQPLAPEVAPILRPTGELKGPEERLNDLYRLLLAPTSFLILISWSILAYAATMMAEHSNLMGSLQFSEDLLSFAPSLLAYALTFLVTSVLVFLAFAWSRDGRFARTGRVASFWLLTFTLSLVGLIFFQVVPPFSGLPTLPYSAQAVVPAIASLLLSWGIVRRVYRKSPSDI